MEAYKAFAGVYDILMRDIDYDKWFRYLRKIWKKHGVNPQLVLDLGCGTGSLSVLLAKSGCDVIGLDSSAEMLSVAAEKAKISGLDILFINQPMENFELYGTVDCIISFFDCINYIINKDELAKTFSLISNYLNPGGLFVFDVNTEYKYQSVLGNGTFADNTDECSYIWENCFDTKTKINEYALSLFIPNNDGSYSKKTEYHYQRAYSLNGMADMLKKAGLTVLGIYDAYTFNKPHPSSERVFFVCKNLQKQEKRLNERLRFTRNGVRRLRQSICRKHKKNS